jgi:enoyl-CoA hydratase
MVTMNENEVLLSVESGLGLITLNRPAALNALTHPMIHAIHAVLDEWESDSQVRAVAIRGAGERGLCAGGDIRAVYEDAKAGGTSSLRFWADEYRLNARIARFPKPYVALMDGLVMGGGVGLSAHGSIRVVTERSRVGMPEVRIGFVPDIGGTYLLSRTPGQLGMHMALTGNDVSGADAIHCGLADYFVPSGRLDELLERLDADQPRATVMTLAKPAPPSWLVEQSAWIDACYSADSVEEVVDRLRSSAGEAMKTAEEITGRSPTSVKLAFRAVRAAASLPSVEAALDQEFRIASHLLRSHDLLEGIRAQIIDKDRNPHWQPATLPEVTDAMVDVYFTPTAESELGLASI